MDDNSVLPTDQQPFRFLDLPKELRLMVYEQLTMRWSLSFSPHLPNEQGPGPTLLVLIRDVDLNILRTCKKIYAEASPIIVMLQKPESTLRIIVDLPDEIHSLDVLETLVSALCVIACFVPTAQRESLTFHQFLVRDFTYIRTRVSDDIGIYSTAEHLAFLRYLWNRARRESWDSVEVALLGHGSYVDHGGATWLDSLHDGESYVSRFLMHLVSKRPGVCGLDMVVYETVFETPGPFTAPNMVWRECEGVSYGGVLDEKTWMSEWV